MTREQLDHFRHRLEEEREALDERIAESGERAREPVDQEVSDLGDEAVRDLLTDTALEVGELRTRQLEEIRDALLRIERGEYGVCEACGRPIELDRLEALPMTRFCKADARRADTAKPPTL
jgi:DnaK suppressor protein